MCLAKIGKEGAGQDAIGWGKEGMVGMPWFRGTVEP